MGGGLSPPSTGTVFPGRASQHRKGFYFLGLSTVSRYCIEMLIWGHGNGRLTAGKAGGERSAQHSLPPSQDHCKAHGWQQPQAGDILPFARGPQGMVHGTFLMVNPSYFPPWTEGSSRQKPCWYQSFCPSVCPQRDLHTTKTIKTACPVSPSPRFYPHGQRCYSASAKLAGKQPVPLPQPGSLQRSHAQLYPRKARGSSWIRLFCYSKAEQANK